jgi:hypothetical protein
MHTLQLCALLSHAENSGLSSRALQVVEASSHVLLAEHHNNFALRL